MKAGLRALIADAELVRRIAHVGEGVACVIQHDVEDHEQILLVGSVDERAEFVVGCGGSVGESGLRANEVVDAVSVIGIRIELKILEHRAEPDRSCTELLDVLKLLLNARKLSALESVEVGIVKRKMVGTCGRIVEAVEHQEVDPAVAPVFGRRERSGGGVGWVDGLIENSLKIGSEERGWHNAPPEGSYQNEEGRSEGPGNILALPVVVVQGELRTVREKGTAERSSISVRRGSVEVVFCEAID